MHYFLGLTQPAHGRRHSQLSFLDVDMEDDVLPWLDPCCFQEGRRYDQAPIPCYKDLCFLWIKSAHALILS